RSRRGGRSRGLPLLEADLLLAFLQELDDGGVAAVAEPAVVLLDDPRIAARPVLVARPQLLEQLLQHRDGNRGRLALLVRLARAGDRLVLLVVGAGAVHGAEGSHGLAAIVERLGPRPLVVGRGTGA